MTAAVAKESQYAVAKKTGLALSLIQGLLKGDREPTTGTLKKLSVYFGVSVADLRGETQEFWEGMTKSLPEKQKRFLINIACSFADELGDVYYDCVKTILEMPDPTCLLQAQKQLHEIQKSYIPAPSQPQMTLKERLFQQTEETKPKK